MSKPTRLTVAAGLAALAWAWLPGTGTAAELPRPEFAPAPAWVDAVEPPLDAPVPSDQVKGGLYDLLLDHQVRVLPGADVHYHRQAWRVLSAAGVQNGSEISIGFDPASERLVLHHARVLRAGRDVAHWVPADWQVIQPEVGRDEQIYDGTLSALLFLGDVRSGDVVDYAFSLVGENDVFGGRFAEDLDLAFDVPIARLRHRLLWPSARPFHSRAHGAEASASERILGADREYVWDRHDVPAVYEEDMTPGSYPTYPFVQVSEFASWADVAAWARALFEAAMSRDASLAALAADWAGLPDVPARALAAVRFVQDDVRYLGIEIGPHSYLPHPPAQTLARRFGDCKDKSVLLASLLRRLGVEAYPALANTEAGRGLDDLLPSPIAFDHAIVRARLDDSWLWIDPTLAEQGGSLRSQAGLDYGRALVLENGAVALTAIPTDRLDVPGTEVAESYVASSGAAPGKLDVVSTYRGADADGMRALLAESSASDLAREYLEDYAQTDPDVRALGAPRVVDDRLANVIAVSESYELPTFWRQGSRTLTAWSISDELEWPDTTRRRTPLSVNHPVRVRHVIRVRAATSAVAPFTRSVASPAFRIDVAGEAAGGEVTLTFDYRSLADSVDVDHLPEHLDALDQAETALAYELSPAGVVGSGPVRRRRPGADHRLGSQASAVGSAPGGSPGDRGAVPD